MAHQCRHVLTERDEWGPKVSTTITSPPCPSMKALCIHLFYKLSMLVTFHFKKERERNNGDVLQWGQGNTTHETYWWWGPGPTQLRAFTSANMQAPSFWPPMGQHTESLWSLFKEPLTTSLMRQNVLAFAMVHSCPIITSYAWGLQDEEINGKRVFKFL